MESGALPDILHIKGPASFDTVDAFMLSAVISVDPSHILHKSDNEHIKDKNNDPDTSLDYGYEGRIPYALFKE